MRFSYDWSMGTEAEVSGGNHATSSAGWRALARDLLIGVAVAVGLWLTVPPPDGVDRTVQLCLAAVAVAALMTREWIPVVAVVGTAAATGAALALGLTADPFVLTGFCLFVAAERRGTRRVPWWLFGGAAVLLLATLGFSADGIEDRFRAAMLGAIVLTASWVLGIRTRQARQEAAIRSRVEERQRLARDVHDVLSHSLGTIGVRAGVAAHVPTLGESDLRAVLHDIEDNARMSLVELKELIRRERASEGDHDATLAAPPLRLPDVLAELARTAERSGLRTRLDISGDVEGLPSSARTTMHRVAQEAVTNAIRHASADSLIIEVRVQGDWVELEVRDDGRGAGSVVREGHGLTGMRERVTIAGGTLRVQTTPGGFVVVARLPRQTSLRAGAL